MQDGSLKGGVRLHLQTIGLTQTQSGIVTVCLTAILFSSHCGQSGVGHFKGGNFEGYHLVPKLNFLFQFWMFQVLVMGGLVEEVHLADV